MTTSAALSTRQATLADVETLAPLFDQYRVWNGQPSNLAGAHAFLQERILLGESILFLAVLGGEAVGFTQLYPSFSSVWMRRLWILNDLFVTQAARGHGAGVALLDAARDLARQSGARGVLLETEGDNLKAQQIYERYGFMRDTAVHYLLAID